MKVTININGITIKAEYYDCFSIICRENKKQKELVFCAYTTKKKVYFTHCLQTVETYSFPIGVELRTWRGSEFYEKSKKNFVDFIESTDFKNVKYLIRFIN